MLTTPHALAGAALGAVSGDPLMVSVAAVASHFVLDSVPHWQETLAPYTPTKKTYIRVPIDLMLAVGLTSLIASWVPDHSAAIWLGALMANAPDLDVILILVPEWKRGIIQRFWDWHCRIQRETASLWGVLPQVIVIVVALVISWFAQTLTRV